MSHFLRDLRVGFRSLIHHPGFSLVAIVTLALGIGANTALFSVVHSVLLRPLPFPQPERLVTMWESVPAIGFDEVGFSPPDIRFFQEQQTSFTQVGAYHNVEFELSGGNARPERIVAARATSEVFEALAVAPVQGRVLSEADDAPGARVALISYGLWQRRYGGDPGIVGQAISLEREPFTVVGVMPPDFVFPIKGGRFNSRPASVWIPRGFTEREYQAYGNMFNHSVIGRLRPGVDIESARTQAGELASRMLEQYPARVRSVMPDIELGVGMAYLHARAVSSSRTPLLVLLVAVGVVLLIGCANVANLLLARASARSQEWALRRALGAARGRLIAQMLAESLLLAGAGASLGLLLAFLLLPVLLSLSPANFPADSAATLNLPVLLFTLVVALLTAVLFSLIPALAPLRSDVTQALKGSSRGAVGAVSVRTQGLFVVSQMALAIVLLVGAGLLLKSFVRLMQTDPGFQSERVLTLTVPLPLAGYPEAGRIRTLYRDLLERTSVLPGVESAGLSTDLPFVVTEARAVFRPIQQGTEFTPPSVIHSWVAGNYLQTMRIPLLRGRHFSSRDRPDSAPVAIISSGLAEQLWAEGEDPIGDQIAIGGGPPYAVVGIVGDVRNTGLAEEAGTHTYVPYEQQSDGLLLNPVWGALRQLKLALRFRGDSTALAAAVRRELAQLDPDLAVSDIRLMDELVADTVSTQRFAMTLLGLFAALALSLSAIGLYGVVSYSVNRRIQEMGLRAALGAARGDLLRLVLRQGIVLSLISLLIGLPAALALSRLMESMLFEVGTADPATYALIPLVLVGVTLAGCYLPARRAASVDPMQALRTD